MKTISTELPGASILLVDHDFPLDYGITSFLHEAGYGLERTQCPKDAIGRIQQNKFDTILISVDLLGQEVASLIESLSQVDPHLPVILLVTPDSEVARGVELVSLGAFDCLTKPYQVHEFKRAIQHALEVKALRQKTAHVSGKLLASEDQLHAVIEAAPDAILIGDEQGQVLSWNLAAEKMFGYAAQEILGKPLTLLMPSRYHEAHRQGLARVRTTGETRMVGKTIELRAVRKDGTEFPIELSLSYARSAGGTFYCGIIRDITQRKEAEQALQESEDRFHLTINNIYDAVFYGDLSGTVLWANQQAAVLLGRPLEAIVGRSLTEYLSPDAVRLVESRLAALRQGLPVDPRVELEVVRSDGSIRWIEANVTSVKRGGEIMGRLLVGRDITERRQYQEAQLRASEQIEKTLTALPGSIFVVERDLRVIYANAEAYRVFEPHQTHLIGKLISDVLPFTLTQWGQMVDDISRQYTRPGDEPLPAEFEMNDRTYGYRLFPVSLTGQEVVQTGIVVWDVTEHKKLQAQVIHSEKLSSLGTLVSGMVHEIRNPLQAIKGMAGLISEECDPEIIRELSADIHRISGHIATILTDFMTYSRPSSREAEGAVDLQARLMEAVKMVQRGPHFEHIDVVQDFARMAPIAARQGEIDQVLINLIANAAQAMRGRGRLTLTTRADETHVVVRITDTGPGISKTVMDKIFEPFFSTKGKGEGTGLGLSIAQQIVKRYRGTISVESTEGVGTTFILRFPAACPARGR